MLVKMSLSLAIPMSINAQKVNLTIDIICLRNKPHPDAFGQNCDAITTKIAELDTKVTKLVADIFVKLVVFMKGKNKIRQSV